MIDWDEVVELLIWQGLMLWFAVILCFQFDLDMSGRVSTFVMCMAFSPVSVARDRERFLIPE